MGIDEIEKIVKANFTSRAGIAFHAICAVIVLACVFAMLRFFPDFYEQPDPLLMIAFPLFMLWALITFQLFHIIAVNKLLKQINCACNNSRKASLKENPDED